MWFGAVANTRLRVGRAFERIRFVRLTNRAIERTRIVPANAVVRTNDSSDDDSTVQTRTVNQRLEHLFSEQVFEVKAGHVQPPSI